MPEATHPVPDVVAPPPGNPRFPLFDGLRAIAALLIVVVHGTIAAGAYGTWFGTNVIGHFNLGVMIFFAISGFLLYRPFVGWRAGGREPGFGRYAWRRLLRVAPAFWVALTVYALIYSAVDLPDLRIFSDHWWVYYGLMGGQTFLFEPLQTCGLPYCFFGPTWSLAIEVSLYALLPLYVIAVEGMTRGRDLRGWLRVEAVGLASLSAVTVFAALYYTHHTDLVWLNFSPLTQMLPFLAGMALAVTSVALQAEPGHPLVDRLRRHAWLGWVAAAPIFVLICAAVPPSGSFLTVDERFVEYVGGSMVAGLLLLPAVFAGAERRAPQRLLGTRVLSWVGLVSYGVFLWHGVIAQLLRQAGVYGANIAFGTELLVLATIAGSIVAGAISYYAIERPILRFKDFTPRGSRGVRATPPAAPQPAPSPRR